MSAQIASGYLFPGALASGPRSQCTHPAAEIRYAEHAMNWDQGVRVWRRGSGPRRSTCTAETAVQVGDPKWNLLLAELSRLGRIVGRSSNDKDCESLDTPTRELGEIAPSRSTESGKAMVRFMGPPTAQVPLDVVSSLLQCFWKSGPSDWGLITGLRT